MLNKSSKRVSFAPWAAAAALVLFSLFPGFAADIGHLGTNQKVLVVCVKWADHANTRMAACADWATLLQNEVNNFYSQATFGQTTFQFEAPAGAPDNGWFALGYNSTDYEFFKTGQDAINLVDPYVDFASYHRVAVITNHPNFGGQGHPGAWWKTNEGKEATFVENGNSVDKRLMSLSIINEWVNDTAYGLPFDTAGSVLAHELGHHLRVRTHYGDIAWFPAGLVRDLLTPWDVMGLSPGMNHFLGWAKFERSWIGPAGVQRVDPPTAADRDVTVALAPTETAAGTRLIQIPITPIDAAHPLFTGYAVENRQLINGDGNLPSNGVLVSFVDENPNTILKAIVLDDPGSPGDLNLATLEVGDSYTDAARNLTISYESQAGNNANVRVQYRLPPAQPPNPRITPWGAPPWETGDVWIDSEKNGWGTFKYVDGSGAPIGNGDDSWVNHVNRVYFKIRNGGLGDATNVRVEVYANSPPGMGDRGPDWAYVGTAMFPSIAAQGEQVGYVNWTPTLGEHTCLKVVIVATDNETSSGDNVAQENVVAWDTSANSPYRARCSRFNVHNPFENRATPVYFLMRDIPAEWKVQIEPPRLTLPPGGSDQVCVVIFPSDAIPEYKPGYIGKTKLEAQVPYANTFIPIGGIDVWTHLTQSSRLTCGLDGEARRTKQVDPKHVIDPMSAGLAPRPGTGGTPAGTAQPNTAKEIQNLFAQTQLVGPESAPAKVAQGESISAKGRLEPALSGATVAVDFVSGDRRVTQLTTTDPSGVWSATSDPSSGGIWEVKAYYAGDSLHAAAESNRCRFEVERAGAEAPACGFEPAVVKLAHWISGVLIALAAVLCAIAYRTRRCWLYIVAALILFALALLALVSCWQPHVMHSIVLVAVGLAVLAWWYWMCAGRRDVAGVA